VNFFLELRFFLFVLTSTAPHRFFEGDQDPSCPHLNKTCRCFEFSPRTPPCHSITARAPFYPSQVKTLVSSPHTSRRQSTTPPPHAPQSHAFPNSQVPVVLFVYGTVTGLQSLYNPPTSYAFFLFAKFRGARAIFLGNKMRCLLLVPPSLIILLLC